MWNDDLKHRRRAGRNLVGGTALAVSAADNDGAGGLASRKVTVFRCVNCSLPGAGATPAAGRRPSQSELNCPIPVHEIPLPCTGRLQPEHLLKAFEAGADAVCVMTCARDNCHYLEGSRRAERRAEYVKELLDEIGLGGDRLLVFHLAAAQDDSALTQLNQKDDGSRAAEIRDMVLARLGALQPTPLGQGKAIL